MTPEQPDARAAQLAGEQHDPITLAWSAWFKATRAALKMDLESLRLLESVYEHEAECEYYDDVVDGDPGTGPWDTATKPGPCTCGLDAHITTLRKHLGIKP